MIINGILVIMYFVILISFIIQTCKVDKLEDKIKENNKEYWELWQASMVLLTALDDCPGEFNYDPKIEYNLRGILNKEM